MGEVLEFIAKLGIEVVVDDDSLDLGVGSGVVVGLEVLEGEDLDDMGFFLDFYLGF